MLFGDEYAAELSMTRCVQSRVHEAELQRLAREAGIGQSNALSRQARCLTCELGRRLVAWGARLEQYSLAHPPTLEGEPGKSQ